MCFLFRPSCPSYFSCIQKWCWMPSTYIYLPSWQMPFPNFSPWNLILQWCWIHSVGTCSESCCDDCFPRLLYWPFCAFSLVPLFLFIRYLLCFPGQCGVFLCDLLPQHFLIWQGHEGHKLQWSFSCLFGRLALSCLPLVWWQLHCTHYGEAVGVLQLWLLVVSSVLNSGGTNIQ